ncbi:acyl-CoA N-acyltransferase [Didymella exigua CBS 183.55]|uniref:Acyl-CoA N-acyltransferase n=1 Tax=Didymella exigua CBS 183.55 TaxID=1150837 RepID=A0A6A5S7F1_9PLEO|nr:acyl-CoA N-acyltransferase [Didymella exigua CBS 183.55]KAF1933437.1 acyl-CoA N-acyltransferase [Didymella exigua CBS 183.55]
MSIVVRDVSDNELHRACIIEAAAYADSDLNPILFPGPFPPDSQQKRVDRLIQMREDDSTAIYMQAIDKASGRMIASSKWHIYKTPKETNIPSKKMEFGSGTNPEACIAFFGAIEERKKETMGDRPHIYLHMLHTDPEFQGYGAGSALIDWGKQKADELGLPIYLESSIVGHGFYKKHGFKDIEVMDIDLSPYGGGLHKQPFMIREVPATG